MDIAHTFALLALAHLFAVMSPGPNAALVIQTAARSRRDAFIVVAGLWPAGALYAIAGLAGLGAALAAAPWLTLALRIVCGVYLLWLGVKMFRVSFTDRKLTARAAPATHLFWQGFVTNITNPKSLVYWASVFTATSAYDLPAWAQVALSLMMPAIGSMWYGSLALIASSNALRTVLERATHWIDRISGTIMVGFGLKLLAQR